MENKTDKEAIFNLAYEAPKNWEVNFKPSYEVKYFSSLRIKKDQSQSMAVEVKPYVLADPGEYPILVKVSSDKAKGEVSLTVVLMGPMERLSAERFQNPLPLEQSILVVYPYIIVLIALTLVCFAISYLVFMLQEIRT